MPKMYENNEERAAKIVEIGLNPDLDRAGSLAAIKTLADAAIAHGEKPGTWTTSLTLANNQMKLPAADPPTDADAFRLQRFKAGFFRYKALTDHVNALNQEAKDKKDAELPDMNYDLVPMVQTTVDILASNWRHGHPDDDGSEDGDGDDSDDSDDSDDDNDSDKENGGGGSVASRSAAAFPPVNQEAVFAALVIALALRIGEILGTGGGDNEITFAKTGPHAIEISRHTKKRKNPDGTPVAKAHVITVADNFNVDHILYGVKTVREQFAEKIADKQKRKKLEERLGAAFRSAFSAYNTKYVDYLKRFSPTSKGARITPHDGIAFGLAWLHYHSKDPLKTRNGSRLEWFAQQRGHADLSSAKHYDKFNHVPGEPFVIETPRRDIDAPREASPRLETVLQEYNDNTGVKALFVKLSKAAVAEGKNRVPQAVCDAVQEVVAKAKRNRGEE